MSEFERYWKNHWKYLDIVIKDDIKNEPKYKEFAKIIWKQAQYSYSDGEFDN
jgi:hypothetical protein